ncbi:MAG: aminotransferase class I/II-fold pyridoxal phosphate-dependent enzyme [Xanthomonadaceae bacterium]|nr:aminotransferase class I/II-fold pyridoxal phosphate-dependent enzyme [Rhodospirillaceae bacterium]NIA17620.1 aminotransferase class I/II-fold pyridoxal phosphate-dependent enzyme [Xanthomonadaceae bacterium]
MLLKNQEKMFNKTKNINLSPIKDIEIRASKIPNIVSLAQGIPSFDTADIIKEKTIEKINKGLVSKYSLSPGLLELREAIEQELAGEKMFYDFETEILVTAGAMEAITASLLAILDKGDEVLLPSPTYTSYQEAIKVANGIPVFVDLIEKDGWAFSIKNFKQKISNKTKAILFCNPNNPTGTIYAKNQLIELSKLAKKYNLYILSDEVYKDFIYQEGEQNNFFSLAQIPELRKRIIRIFSFSKSHAMTGWRVGFLHSDVSIVKEILKIHDSLVTCAPVVSQYAALAALEYGREAIKFYKQEYIKRRELICRRLDKLKNIFSYQKPNSSYYVFPDYSNFSKLDSWKFSIKLLEEGKVAVVPGVAFGPNGENHIRLSFGRTEEDINKAFDRMEEYFK